MQFFSPIFIKVATSYNMQEIVGKGTIPVFYLNVNISFNLYAVGVFYYILW